MRVTHTPQGIWAVAAGIAGDPTQTVWQHTSGNRWQGNHYVVCSYIRFFWKGEPATWAQWQAANMDTMGSINQVC